MVKIERASLEVCKSKALPIFTKGYEQRGTWKSSSENSVRANSKRERDEHANTRPHLSTI
jgi:hypothetical protein